MKKKLFFLLTVFISVALLGQHQGTLTERNVQIGDCLYSSVTVKYKLDHFFGEPTVNGSFKLQGDENCKLPIYTSILLKIENGNNYGFIKITPALPKINEGYGYNVTGSPNWSDYICKYRGSHKANCADKDTAKEIYRTGSVTSFDMIW